MFQKKVLGNGLRVILIPQKETKAVTLLVLCRVGSRYESSSLNGAAHFLEHLFFKGTKRRPTTLDLSRELDGLGAEYNAYTAKDHTGFYIKVVADKFPQILDILADMLFASKFDKREIARERNVILEEMNMYEDNPLIFCEELLNQAVFGQNHPLGFLTIGVKKTIQTITRKSLLNFKDHFYAPANMVVALVGRIPNNALEYIKRYFAQKGRKTFPNFKKFKNKKREIILRWKDSAQVQIALGVPAYALRHRLLPALTVLHVILGSNMSSRLFINIREKRGLAYFIKSDLDAFEDTGVFFVQAGLDKTRISEAVQAILAELKRIKVELITKEELKKAKDFLTGKVALELEESSAVASWYGRQEILLRELKTPEEKLREIRKVSREDVKKVAQEILQEEKINLVVIGPFKNKNYFMKLLKL